MTGPTSTSPTADSPASAAVPAPAGPRLVPMSLWRLEWLRLVRSPRAAVLCGVYTFFGLLAPVLVRYMSQLTRYASSSVQIIVPDPTPRDGMLNYVGQTGQTGLIVVVVVAAGALTLDSQRGMAAFYRTRAAGLGALLMPRYVVSTAAAATASTLGTLACWYATTLLLGDLPAGAVLAGAVCSAAYLAFAVAVVAAAASLARGTLGTVGISLGVLLVLPVLGLIDPVHPWLPSTLVQAPAELLGGSSIPDFARALAVALVAVPLLLRTATHRLARREV
jgi:ABC-2 type transport system permease protein